MEDDLPENLFDDHVESWGVYGTGREGKPAKNRRVHYAPVPVVMHVDDWVMATAVDDDDDDGIRSFDDEDDLFKFNQTAEPGYPMTVVGADNVVEVGQYQPVETSDWYPSAEEESEDDGSDPSYDPWGLAYAD